MIKKLVLKLTEDATGYWFIANARTGSDQLENIPLALSEYRNDFNVHIDELEDKGVVFIWSKDLIKNIKEQVFNNQQEENAFEETYYEYYNKRWNEMPKVELSISDWKALQKKWDQLKKEKYQYVIFTSNDSGSLDKIDVVGKNELSDQDKEDMQREHEEYLRYQKARQEYIAHHPDYSYEWRGPQDDEYEEDIMKYYDKD